MSVQKLQTLVIGGGVSGLYTAHLLASLGLEVAVFEKNANLFTGASGRNWARLHLGQMSAGRITMSQRIMSVGMFAAPVLRDFLLEPPIRPEYFIASSDLLPSNETEELTPEVFRRNADFLQSYFGIQSERDPVSAALFQGPYFEKLDKSYTCSIVRGNHVGFSSNEVGIDLAKLCASLEFCLSQNDNVTLRLGVFVDCIVPEGSQYRVYFHDMATQQHGELLAENIVNAAWETSMLLDDGMIDWSTNEDRHHIFRMQLYGVVDGIQSEGVATYRSVQSKYGAHYYEVAPNKAIIEVSDLSNFDFMEDVRPAWWNGLLHNKLNPCEIGHYVAPLLEACQKQFRGIFDDAQLVDGLFGSFWVEGLDKGVVGANAYRSVRSEKDGYDRYYPYAAEKLPACIKSAINTAVRVYASQADPATRCEINTMLQNEESRSLRDFVLAQAGAAIAVAPDSVIYDYRKAKSNAVQTVETYSATRYASPD